MAAISVTYTFSNGATADASQVNTNFTDIINGTSDGSKDFSINTLTAAGTATFNGAVTLGNATGDDITITGSIAATINWKTNATGDIGSSTLAPASIYLGNNTRTIRLLAPTITSTYTITLPVAAGSAGNRMINTGSATMVWSNDRSPDDLSNLSITASVGSSALTINVTSADGTALSATNPAYAVFRSATAATGAQVQRAITADISVVISSGSTLGLVSAQNEYIYVYLIDNAGTVEVGVVGGAPILDEGTRQTSTAEGGGGAADTRYTFYSTTARSSIGIRLLGRVLSNQVTSGTYALAPTEITVKPSLLPGRNEVVVNTGGGHGSTNTMIRRITVEEYTFGTAITWADSATAGTSFTINAEGVYSMTYCDGHTAAANIGISVNSSQLTTNVGTITAVDRLIRGSTQGSGLFDAVASCRRFKPGDIIRPHTDGGLTNTSDSVKFSIVRVAL